MKGIITSLMALLIAGTELIAQPQPPGQLPSNMPGPPRGQPGIGGLPSRPQSFRPTLPPRPMFQPRVQFPQVTNWGTMAPPIGPSITTWAPARPFVYDPVPYAVAPVAQVPDLDGYWYLTGDPAKPAQIIQRRLDGRALFINEQGSQAWGSVQGDTVYIPDWTDGFRQGLVGTIRGDRIIWPDGNFWSRNPRW